MDWINDPRLWVAITPVCVFIGAAIAFYLATESGDNDPYPEVNRGETDWEPWGIPNIMKKYRLPGDSIQRTKRVTEHDMDVTAVMADERKYDLAEVQE